MADSSKNDAGDIVPDILKDDEGFREIMGLFREKGFFQRLASIASGLRKPSDSREYKEARTNLQRLAAPFMAIAIPCVVILLLVVLGKASKKDALVVEVQVEQQEELQEELQDIDEPPPQDVFDDFTPTDIDISSPNMNVDVVAQVAPDVPVSAQPQAVDAVLPVKSPVTLRNVYGSTRSAGMRAQMLASGGGNARTEASVMRALRWLKATQNDNGSWPGNDVAMTGLAILTFLAHGEQPGTSEEFGETMQRAMEFLMRRQESIAARIKKEYGEGYGDGYYEMPPSDEKARKAVKEGGSIGGGYAHAIATYAMCEAYGMTMNPNIRASADKALKIIIDGQQPDGGWDYMGFWRIRRIRTDTSVSGWCAQALKAGVMADFYHDKEELDRASRLCVKGFKKNGSPEGGFGYTGPAKGGGLTGVGVLCLQFHHAANDPYVKASLDNVISKWKPQFVGSAPTRIRNEKPKDLPPGAIGGSNPAYYAYYGTQAVFQSGGKRWEEWNKIMWPSYVESQFVIPAGKTGADCVCGQERCQKKVTKPYVDHRGNEQEIGHWVNVDETGANSFRPVMDTCLAALQMMVYYRYLPTFKQVDVPEEIVADITDSDDIIVDSNL
ncbi:MAG: terpene cyclase/mutase family protein [Kiritimatiellae bacterium]|nr:terpene cyclase/mutase family protein [Kiritimatiellia bacterium]